MGSGCTPRIFAYLGVFCVVAASDTGSHMLGFLGRYQSWGWGYALPWVVGALIFGGIASYFRDRAIEERQNEENEDARDESLPFVLLLRPFSSDGKIEVPNPDRSGMVLLPSYHFEEETIAIERLLAQTIGQHLQIRALGGSPQGPGVVRTSEDSWRARFQDLAAKAECILILVLPGQEILWEAEQVRARNYLNKTVFILSGTKHLDIDQQEPVEAQWKKFTAAGFCLPSFAQSTQIVTLNADGRLRSREELGRLSYQELDRALSFTIPRSLPTISPAALRRKKSRRKVLLGWIGVVLLAAVAGLLINSASQRMEVRRTATTIKNDLRLIDAAIDQYAIEYNLTEGTVRAEQLVVYLKPGGRLAETWTNELGHRYADQFEIGTLPRVPAESKEVLAETIPNEFWAPYD